MTPGSYADQLGAAAQSLRELHNWRDNLIRKRRRQGATLRQIAAEANLTAAGVKKILDRNP